MGISTRVVFSICIISFFVSIDLTKWVLAKDVGPLAQISYATGDGAEGFFKTHYGTISKMVVLLGLVILSIYLLRDITPQQAAAGIGRVSSAFITVVSFLLGALCSGVAGYVGMWVSVRANVRVSSAARQSASKALQIAVRAAGFSAIIVVGMAVLGIAILYAAFYVWLGVDSHGTMKVTDLPLLFAGYGFGPSFVALFAQLGGTVYMKAADVGADLAGKVEQGIPEDDPRNPAVIADLVDIAIPEVFVGGLLGAAYFLLIVLANAPTSSSIGVTADGGDGDDDDEDDSYYDPDSPYAVRQRERDEDSSGASEGTTVSDDGVSYKPFKVFEVLPETENQDFKLVDELNMATCHSYLDVIRRMREKFNGLDQLRYVVPHILFPWGLGYSATYYDEFQTINPVHMLFPDFARRADSVFLKFDPPQDIVSVFYPDYPENFIRIRRQLFTPLTLDYILFHCECGLLNSTHPIPHSDLTPRCNWLSTPYRYFNSEGILLAKPGGGAATEGEDAEVIDDVANSNEWESFLSSLRRIVCWNRSGGPVG